jgi:hypothetical protein
MVELVKEIARGGTFCVLPKVDDMGRREGPLVEHMVDWSGK